MIWLVAALVVFNLLLAWACLLLAWAWWTVAQEMDVSVIRRPEPDA